MNRTLVLGSMVALLVSGLMLWQAISARRSADEALAAEMRRTQSAQAAFAGAQKRVEEAKAKSDAARVALEQLERKPPVPGKENAPSSQTGGRNEGGMSFAEVARKWAAEYDRPENQVRWFAQQRRSNQKRYEPLFRELQLTEAQRAEFIDNLARRDERVSDLNAAAHALGMDSGAHGVLSAGAGEISKLRGDIYTEASKAQKALLGETGYQRVQEFDRTAGLREAVGNMAGLAAVSGMALSSAQLEQIVRKVAEQSPEYRKGGRASLLDTNPADLSAALASVLTAEQQKLFATQESPGAAGAIFHAQWNAALVQATKVEKQKVGTKSGGP